LIRNLFDNFSPVRIPMTDIETDSREIEGSNRPSMSGGLWR
jgi:hypothetical protein